MLCTAGPAAAHARTHHGSEANHSIGPAAGWLAGGLAAGLCCWALALLPRQGGMEISMSPTTRKRRQQRLSRPGPGIDGARCAAARATRAQ